MTRDGAHPRILPTRRFSSTMSDVKSANAASSSSSAPKLVGAANAADVVKVRLYVGVVTTAGQVSTDFMKSIAQLTSELIANQIECAIECMDVSYQHNVHEVRNHLLTSGFESGAKCVLLLDGDLGWTSTGANRQLLVPSLVTSMILASMRPPEAEAKTGPEIEFPVMMVQTPSRPSDPLTIQWSSMQPLMERIVKFPHNDNLRPDKVFQHMTTQVDAKLDIVNRPLPARFGLVFSPLQMSDLQSTEPAVTASFMLLHRSVLEGFYREVLSYRRKPGEPPSKFFDTTAMHPVRDFVLRCMERVQVRPALVINVPIVRRLVTTMETRTFSSTLPPGTNLTDVVAPAAPVVAPAASVVAMAPAPVAAPPTVPASPSTHGTPSAAHAVPAPQPAPAASSPAANVPPVSATPSSPAANAAVSAPPTAPATPAAPATPTASTSAVPTLAAPSSTAEASSGAEQETTTATTSDVAAAASGAGAGLSGLLLRAIGGGM